MLCVRADDAKARKAGLELFELRTEFVHQPLIVEEAFPGEDALDVVLARELQSLPQRIERLRRLIRHQFFSKPLRKVAGFAPAGASA